MVVRIRFSTGPRVRRRGTKNQRLALAFAALLVPAVVSAWALALWRLASDLRFAGAFAFSDGVLSHWLVWALIAVGLQSAAMSLNRYGHRPDLAEAEADPQLKPTA